MNTLEIPEKDISVEIPSHWDEMTHRQRIYCLRQGLMATSGMVDMDTARISCLYHLLGISSTWGTIARERVSSELRVQEKYSRILLLAEELCGFLFSQDKDGRWELSYETVYNHFPILQAGKVTLHGPAHLLADVSMGEFRAAVEEMREYFEDRNPHALHRMIACLYRPQRREYEVLKEREDFDGLRREPMNRARIEDNARHAAKVSSFLQQAVLMWFSYMIGYIQKEPIVLSGNEVSFQPLFQGGGDSGRSTGGWDAVLRRVGKDGPFGDVEKTDRAGLYDVLLYMLDCHEENRKLKRNLKKK